MKTCCNTIRLLAFLILLISCKKESILEREASLSDKELLEKGQLIYFGSYADGLYRGKLLSNDTIKVTRLYDAGDYADDVLRVGKLEINNGLGAAYWLAGFDIYMADVNIPSSKSVKKVTSSGSNIDFSIDQANQIVYTFSSYTLLSFDINTNKTSKVLDSYDFNDHVGLKYFDENIYFISWDNDLGYQVVKSNVRTTKTEVLYQGEQEGLFNPIDLAIDKANKKLFVIDRDGLTSKAIIREGDMEGTGKMEKILEIGTFDSNIEYDEMLEYDQKNGYFFWYDDDKRSIGRIKKGESISKYWYLEQSMSDFTVPEIDK